MTTRDSQKSLASLGFLPASNLIANAPKRQYKAADHVVDSLRRGILSGDLERGSRLPNERQLANEFGLSQPTIREAIRVLEYMSLVEVRHGSGTYVTGDSQGFVSKSLQALLEVEKGNVGLLEILELKRVLSLYSIELAVDRATKKDLRALDSLEDELSKAIEKRDYRETIEAAMCFQAAMSAAARNPLLYALEAFLIEVQLGCQLVEWTNPPEEVTLTLTKWDKTLRQDRLQLLNALRSRNKKQSVHAMDIYLQHQIKHLSAYTSLEDIDISDSKQLYAVANTGLSIPTYRDMQNIDI